MKALPAACLWPAGDLAQVVPASRPRIATPAEGHDNPADHAEQARLVADLLPTALVREMLPAATPARAAGLDRTDAAVRCAALQRAGSGWPDFALYHRVIAAAPGAALFGAAVPDGRLRDAMATGAATAFGGDAADWALGPQTLADLLPGMVEAQRLRDAHLGRMAVGAFDAPGAPVVVIAGTGHARGDRNIPVHTRAVRDAPPIPRANPCAWVAAGRQGPPACRKGCHTHAIRMPYASPAQTRRPAPG